jgi:hypothetical protein
MTPPRVPVAKIVIDASGEHCRNLNGKSPPCPPESEL